MKLPPGWASATVGDLGDYLNGLAFKPDDWGSDGIGIIRIQNLTDPDKPLNRTTRPFDERYRIKRGDLLVSWSATLDAFVWDRDDAVVNQHIFKVTPSSCVVPKFLFYQLRELISEMAASEHLHGSTMRHINRGPFLAHAAALPPLAEQSRIAAKLDALSARLARARAELERTQQLADRLREASLSVAFSKDRLSKWRFCKLEDVVREGQIGLVRSKSDQTSDGTPYIRMNHFDLDGRWNDGSLTCVQVLSDELRRYELRAGDVLFNTRNSVELVGKVAIWPDDKPAHVYNNNLLRLRFVEQIMPEFAFRFMMSPPFRAELETLKSATTSVAAIYQKPLYKTDMPVPSLKEQQAIASQISAAFSRAYRIEAEATRARALLDRLEAAILTKAFRGELVLQDPNDEPASVLLERIRAQHVAAPMPKQTRRAGHDRRTQTLRLR